MKSVSLFLVIFFLVPCTSAVKPTPPLASACQTLSENYSFEDCTQDIYTNPDCQCNSLPYLGSLALCISEYADSNLDRQQQWRFVATSGCIDSSDHGYNKQQKQRQWQYVMGSSCSALSNQDENDQYKQQQWQYVKHAVCKDVPNATVNTISMQDLLANATKFVIPLPANATTDHLFAPIRFPQEKLVPIIRTVKEFNNQLQYGLNYGGACSALVCTFIVLGMLNNLFHHCVSWRYNTDTKPKALPPSPSWIRAIRRHIINPSLFFDGVHLENASWFGVMVSYPTRFESIFIFLYVAMNVFILFPSYDLFVENTFWPDDIAAQLGRYIADRSGEISFAQLPMVYLFGGRNNILIWLTGWSYDRFIIAHKWTSRMMMFHAIVHSAAYTWVGLHDGFEAYASYYDDLYFRWGVAATVLGSFILLLALPNLRRKCYDFFLYTHIVFVVLFTVACWYHVALLEDEENMVFLYVSIAVWSFDRVARFVRVVYYNLMLATGRRCLRSVKAGIIPGTDCIRFRVDANKCGLSHRLPGAFVYIYIPRVYFWQSHPFTIASWHPPSLDTATHSGNGINEPRPSSTDSVIHIHDDSISPTFDLLIRPQNGMTKKLYDVVKKLGPCGELDVLIEGPYGHTHPVLQYETAILVGGGVGCTATVPYLQEAVYNATKNATRHLVFIWVVQQDDQLHWAQQDIEDCLAYIDTNKKLQTGVEDIHQHTSLDVSIFVTRSTRNSGWRVTYGHRPDLAKLLGQYIDAAQGSVAILHCGPGRMSDQVRQISAYHGVTYFEEAFEW